MARSVSRWKLSSEASCFVVEAFDAADGRWPTAHRMAHDVLARIMKGVTEVRADDPPQTLNFCAPFSLARWLIPRLADFRRRHPKPEVMT